MDPGDHAKRRSGGKRHHAIDVAIRDSRDLTCTERCVLLVLNIRIGWTRKPDRPPGTCYPSVGTIAQEAGISRSTAQATIRKLAGRGWLALEPRRNGPGSASWLYRITPPETDEGAR